MKWGGIIAGGVGGLGKGIAQYGNQMMEDQSKRELLDYQYQLDAQKAQAAEAMRRDGVIWGTTGEGGVAKREAAKLDYEQETELGTKRLKDQAPVKREIAVEDAKAEGRARGEVDRENTIAAGADRKYIAAKKAIAAASHYFGPGEQLAALKLKEYGAISELRSKLANTKDEGERQNLQRQIEDLDGRGLGRGDKLKIIADLNNSTAHLSKILSDPAASDEAKQTAREGIAAARATAAWVMDRRGISGEAGGDADPFADIAKALKDQPKLSDKKGGGQGAAAVPAGDTAMFARMDEEELQRYVTAGNALAKAEQRKRKASTTKADEDAARNSRFTPAY